MCGLIRSAGTVPAAGPRTVFPLGARGETPDTLLGRRSHSSMLTGMFPSTRTTASGCAPAALGRRSGLPGIRTRRPFSRDRMRLATGAAEVWQPCDRRSHPVTAQSSLFAAICARPSRFVRSPMRNTATARDRSASVGSSGWEPDDPMSRARSAGCHDQHPGLRARGEAADRSARPRRNRRSASCPRARGTGIARVPHVHGECSWSELCGVVERLAGRSRSPRGVIRLVGELG